MKPLFSTDILLNWVKLTEEELAQAQPPEGDYYVKSLTDEQCDRISQAQENASRMLKKGDIPLWLKAIRMVLFFVLLIAVSNLLKGFSQAGIGGLELKSAAAALISAIVCIVITLIKKKRAKDFENSDSYDEAVSVMDEIDRSFNYLGIPQNTDFTEIIEVRYKQKDSKIKVQTGILKSELNYNVQCKIHGDNQALYISDGMNLFKIPKSELKAIKTVNEKLALAQWYKDEPYNSQSFEKYKLVPNQAGHIYVEPFHILEIEHKGQSYGIYFPCYELEKFEKATGLKAE